MAADPSQLARMGENGRRFVVERYSRQAQAHELEKLLTGQLY
jgi:glycosyltransferase involved in cell wall biosynthesis